MKLSDKDFYTLFGAALEAKDQEMYIAEWGTSSIFFKDPDSEGPEFDDIVNTLSDIWTKTHMSIKEIRAKTGLSQAAFGTRLCIPTRTIENWESGKSNPPPYLRLLLLESPRLTAP